MIDVVFPKKNEKKFMEVAKKLGIKGLVFVYAKKEKHLDKIKELSEKNFKILTGLFVQKNIQLTHANAFDLIFATADRSLVESKKVDVVIPEDDHSGRDSTHQRKSGLNEVLCKIGKEKMFAFSFYNLLNSKQKEIVLGRQMQNIRLLKKNKVFIGSFARKPYDMKAPKDLMAYGAVLGLHPAKAKAAVNRLVNFIY